MGSDTYRFEIRDHVNLDDVELTLAMAVIAAEGLFGGPQVRLSVSYHRIHEERAIVVQAGTEVAEAVVRMFVSFLTRQFGGESFTVRRGRGCDQSALPASVA
jgi:predicted Zn-dependent protease